MYHFVSVHLIASPVAKFHLMAITLRRHSRGETFHQILQGYASDYIVVDLLVWMYERVEMHVQLSFEIWEVDYGCFVAVPAGFGLPYHSNFYVHMVLGSHYDISFKEATVYY